MSQEVLCKLKEHKNDGEVFLQITDEYLREIAPLLGDCLKIRRVINDALVNSSDVSEPCMHNIAVSENNNCLLVSNFIAPSRLSITF